MAKKMAVLFVDDEKRVLNSLKRALINEDFKSFFALSGAEALQLLQSEDIQVVVSDMKMPEMNGLELLQQVAESFPDVVRIVLSGYSHTSTVIAAVNEGRIFRYITKPWNIESDIKPALEAAFVLYAKRQMEREQAEKLQHDNVDLQSRLDTGLRQIDQTKKVASEIYLRKTGAQRRSLERVAQLLGNISGLAGNLEMVGLEGESLKLVSTIREHCHQALSGLEKVKLLYALELGKRKPLQQAFPLTDFCRQLEARTQRQAQILGMTVVFQKQDALPEKIVSDRELLSVMVWEIIENALAVCSSGAIIVCSFKFGKDASGALLSISVRDTGPGIGAQQMKNLQQPFICGSERQPDPVWGVGLALARMIASRLHGSLGFVENAQGCQVDMTVEVADGCAET